MAFDPATNDSNAETCLDCVLAQIAKSEHEIKIKNSTGTYIYYRYADKKKIQTKRKFEPNDKVTELIDYLTFEHDAYGHDPEDSFFILLSGRDIERYNTFAEAGFNSEEKMRCVMDVNVIYRLRGGGLAMVEISKNENYLTFRGGEFNNQLNDFSDKIICSSYHVSCQSDKIPKDSITNISMLGLVLYRYDGKTDWYLNGIHCKTGYIIIKYAKNIENIETKDGTMHSKLFYYLFKKDLKDVRDGNWHWVFGLLNRRTEMIGGGFAIRDGNIVYNSSTFNENDNNKMDTFHDCNRDMMDDIERRAIHCAIRNWRFNLKQNTYVKDMDLSRNYCNCKK